MTLRGSEVPLSPEVLKGTTETCKSSSLENKCMLYSVLIVHKGGQSVMINTGLGPGDKTIKIIVVK